MLTDWTDRAFRIQDYPGPPLHSTAFQNLIRAWEYLHGWLRDEIQSKKGEIIQHSG
jgi:hypothetical protein